MVQRRGRDEVAGFFFPEEKAYGKFIQGKDLLHESKDGTFLCQKLKHLKAHNSVLVQQLY